MKAIARQDGRHKPSGRWRLGFVLAASAALLWSTVPIALSLLLDRMDAITITWYRFAFGALVLGVILKYRGTLPAWHALVKGRRLWLVAIAGISLAGNFVLYVYALNFISPGASQVVMQLAPLFVLFGGVVVFREPFRPIQWGGLCLLIAGLLLFFNHRLGDFIGSLTDYSYGALLVVSAAAVWALYALAQKQLLSTASSMGIMLVLYAIGVVVMLPFSTLTQIRDLSAEQFVVLAYSSANVLIGYGCFAEALRHWEASRVSTVICTTPLFTLAFSHPAHTIWPDRILPDDMNAVGLIGASLVVAGLMLAALGGRQPNAVEDG